jgi:hypothetical protein
MAEKRYLKGLFKDTGHLDQPEGTWRHARNMVIGSLEGTINNEGGTSLAGHLKAFKNVSYGAVTGDQNKKVIGIIRVNENKVVIFSTDVVSPAASFPRSEIGIWQDDVYRIIFNPLIDPTAAPAGKLTNDLNFKQSHPIQGTFKIDSKGDLIVYWTDDLNPPRAFNVGRQIRDSGFNFTQLYGIFPLFIDNIDILNLFPYSGPVPHIYIGDIFTAPLPYQDSVKEGGGLLTGAYYLALAYVDDDLVATNYLTVSSPISIVEEYDHTRPTVKKDGAKEGSQTSKSITWRVNNFNLNYKYIRPVIIRKKGEATEVFKLNDLEIKLNSAIPAYQEITYSGLETVATGSPSEVIIDTISYDTVKTIQQLDNILYLGNTTGTKDLGYQKYANNIKSSSIVKLLDPFDELWLTADALQTGFGQSVVDLGNYVDHTKSYRYVPNITNYRGYMRDEVYAFYIAFIMNDGSMSYAYHIPGRRHLTNLSYTGYDISAAGQSEKDTVPLTTLASQALNALSSSARIFHFYDQSFINSGANSIGGASRHMQFWENATETYPSSVNFQVWDESGQISLPLGSIQGQNVRHHKMPSNANASRTTVVDDPTLTSSVVITDSITDPTPPVPGSYTGAFFTKTSQGTGAGACGAGTIQGNTWLCDDWTTDPGFDTIFNDAPTNVDANGLPVSATTVFAANTFTAPTNFTTVTVEFRVRIGNDNACAWHTGYGRMKENLNSGVTYSTTTSATAEAFSCSCINTFILPYIGYVSGWDRISFTKTYLLMAGESLKPQMTGYAGNSPCLQRRITPLQHGATQCYGTNYPCHTVESYIKYTVSQGAAEDYHDANVKHQVNILGMNFDDIKIPASYKDKIQGFRIYRAKRTYSNKTILGQGPIIPMREYVGTLGSCQEAVNSPLVAEFAAQSMGAIEREPETFYACTAWKTTMNRYQIRSGSSDQYSVNPSTGFDEGYKNLQFYDFNLLREKSSLAPATHIQVQYVTHDLVWNGPEINQPKKMLTYVSQPSGTPLPPLEIKEIWGWDMTGNTAANGNQNCYTKNLDSAMFMGARYTRGYLDFSTNPTYGLNRVLGQKAKSYIIGDTIFNAGSLGFGGKLVNTGGNSSIAIGVKNQLELPAIASRPYTLGFPNCFGCWTPGMGFNLVTQSLSSILGTGSILGLPLPARHKNYIVNLNAFKTDVYKNIDNQELVWTGYEVLGADLDNFIFEPDGTSSGTFSTANIIPVGADTPGVFGGDTFIARYGIAEAYAPTDDQTLSTPSSAIYSYIVESPDNVALRHAESDDSLYYPGSVAKDVLSVSGRVSDLNHIDNLKYNNNYSAENDIRPAFPLPVKEDNQTEFSTRTHRSVKNDTTSMIDNYRIFLANQFKDLPKNRGELWTLASFNNLLYFHMEESLFAAQGKQTMEMKDGSEAFVGSGDIFTQDPNEMIQTDGGFGGTQSQWAALTTRFGYFFVDQRSKKVFLMTDQLKEISNLGMQNWFSKNLTFNLASYGMGNCAVDNPIAGIGLHAIYDPLYKRIILTKRDVEPTDAFDAGITLGNNPSAPCTIGEIYWVDSECKFRICKGCKGTSPCPEEYAYLEFSDTKYFTNAGWTISYYPELNVWGSFHDYVPYIYFNTSTDFYSFTDQYPRPVWVGAPATPLASWSGTTYGNAGIWKHNATAFHGILYQENTQNRYTDADYLTRINYHPFEFEFIHNEYKAEDALVSSINYTLETFNQENISILNHGFTSFFVYNTFQMSGENLLEYFIHTRRVGNNWKINKFRDMANIALNTTPYYMSTNSNITGGINVGTITTSEVQDMFIYDTMFKNVNPFYLNLGKAWNLQKKFIDKWVGIRLIYNNISNNFLNLYSTDVVARKSIR